MRTPLPEDDGEARPRHPDELSGDWEIYRPDGRPYLMEEWPLVRSITSG
jgi:hypothetical protein